MNPFHICLTSTFAARLGVPVVACSAAPRSKTASLFDMVQRLDGWPIVRQSIDGFFAQGSFDGEEAPPNTTTITRSDPESRIWLVRLMG